MNLNAPVDLYNSFKSVTAGQGANMIDVLLLFIQNHITKNLSPKSKELRVLAERWRIQYNTVRPHSSLSHRPPAPEAQLSGTKAGIG